MNTLPDELLIKVFEKLCWRDRLNAATVKQHWSDIMPFRVTSLDLVSAVIGTPDRETERFPCNSTACALIEKTGPMLESVSFGRHNLLITPMCIDLLEKHCPNLSHLDLSFCTVTERIVPSLIRIAERIRTLNLSNTHFSLQNFETHRTNMCIFFASMINLEAVNLTKTSIQNFVAISYLSSTVKSLVANSCSPIRQTTLTEFLTKAAALEELRLSTYTGLDDMLLDLICSTSSLKIFEWSHINFGHLMTHDGGDLVDLEMLSDLRNLTELHLQHNHLIYDDALESICEKCPNIKVLNLSYCRSLTYYEPLQSLKNLQTLYVASTASFTDATAVGIATNKELTIFHAIACPQLTDATCVAVAAFCKGLTEVNLNQCELITSHGFQALCQGCPLIDCLSLGCSAVDDSALQNLKAKHLPHLRTFDVSFCRQISETGLASLMAQLQPHLKNRKEKEVDIYVHQTSVSLDYAKKVAPLYKNIQIHL